MKAVAVTNVGNKRSMNQDYYFCSDEPVGMMQNLYIVADGMGGHNAGDYAARFSVDRFVTLVRESKERTPISVMENALKITNEELIAKAKTQREYDGMGTTFVAATLQDDGYLLIANIGDSRGYLINQDGITRITRDHSVVEDMVARGELTPEEARHHPKRNLITRALGPDRQARADTYPVDWKQGDFILLCSDGLVNTVSDQEILFEVIHGGEPDDCLDRLLALSRQRGAPDNVTIVLIWNA